MTLSEDLFNQFPLSYMHLFVLKNESSLHACTLAIFGHLQL